MEMKISVFARRSLFSVVLLLSSVFITACDGDKSLSVSGSPATLSIVTMAEAEESAKRIISASINSNSGVIKGASTNLFGESGSTATNKPSVFRVLNKAFKTATAGDSGTSGKLDQQVTASLDRLFSGGIREGDTISYDPDEQALCVDDVLGKFPAGSLAVHAGQAAVDCTAFFSHVTLRLTILGVDRGRLTILYDTYTLMTIGYEVSNGTNVCYMEFDLAQLKSIVSTIAAEQNTPETLQLPASFDGVIRLTVAGLGVDHGRITLSIEQSINIVDEVEKVSINMVSTEKVFELEANALYGTSSLEVALNAINIMFQVTDINAVKLPAKLIMNGLTLRADITENGDNFVVTNIGIGGAPALFNVIDSTGVFDTDPEDLKLTLATFGFTVNSLTETLTFDEAFNLEVVFDDSFGVFADIIKDPSSGFTVGVTRGTQLKARQNALTRDVLEVTGSDGLVTQSGAGDFSGGTPSFSTGACFKLNDKNLADQNLPLVEAGCF